MCECVTSVNGDIGEEGAKALGPHLAKLHNMTTLDLSCAWWRWCLDVDRTWLFVGGVARMMVAWLLRACAMSDNNIGEEGAKALGPHLAKLNSMTTLYLSCTWW